MRVSGICARNVFVRIDETVAVLIFRRTARGYRSVAKMPLLERISQPVTVRIVVARRLSWEDRQAPFRWNGPLRCGHFYRALNNEVIRPCPEPAKNWESRARKRLGPSPQFLVNGRGQGEPECFLGRRRAFDAAAMS